MIAIRQAQTHAERLAVTEVAHAANRPELPLETFQAGRLAHPRRATATWWLLEEDGRALCSLVVHPLVFKAGGPPQPGYGIGAVATRPEARRRGHAAALCRHAIERAEAEGRGVGLLYSAIAPAYYERLAFQTRPAWQHACTEPGRLAASGARARLTPLDPRRAAAELATLYESHHGEALHLHRDAAGFARSIALSPFDLYLGLGAGLDGYVRVLHEGGSLEVVELIVPPAERASALRALGDLATRLGCTRLEGWFAPCDELAAHFVDEGRSTTLPMVRGHVATSRDAFWSSDYF